jgi:hypothetical protein
VRPSLAGLLGLVLGASLTGASPAGAEEPGGADGIRWEASVEGALERSAQEGRPVLLCVNALESESANNALATVHYRSAEWGAATRGFVCLVGNPGDHGSDAGGCRRYDRIPCAAHRAALDLVLRLFGPDLISPQHVVLEPDGGVFWRKEYWSGDVTPEGLLGLFVEAAPRLAIVHAGHAREKEVERLAKAPAKEAVAAATSWLAPNEDPLAAPAIVGLVVTTDDPRRRVALVRALGRAAPALRLASADAAFRAPEDDPALAAAWVESLAEEPAAAPTLARLAVRTKDPALRSRALAAVAALAPDLARETRWLLGDRAGATAPAPDAPLRTRRAEARAGLRARVHPPLATALDAESAGDLRGALLEADAAEVRASAARVAVLVEGARQERVRLAAALALLRAGPLPEGVAADVPERVAALLVATLGDAVEGPDTRAEAVRRLGDDPGHDPDVWRAALLGALRGAK